MNRFIGIGTTIHRFINSNGQYIFLSCISYHLTQTDVQIFSPQTYHKMHCGYSVVQWNQLTMHLTNHSIHVPIGVGGTNLPVVRNSFVTEYQKRAIGPQMLLSLVYSRLSKLDVFGDLKSFRCLQDMDISSDKIEI